VRRANLDLIDMNCDSRMALGCALLGIISEGVGGFTPDSEAEK